MGGPSTYIGSRALAPNGGVGPHLTRVRGTHSGPSKSNVSPSVVMTAVIDILYSTDYTLPVFTIKRTDEFNAWLLS